MIQWEFLTFFQGSRWNYIIFWETRVGESSISREKAVKATKTRETHLVAVSRFRKLPGALETQGALMHFGAAGTGGLFEGCFWRWQYRNAQVGLIKLWSPDKTVQCTLVISGIHKSLATRRVNAYARTCIRAHVRYACVHAYYKPPTLPPANAVLRLRRPPRRRRPRLAE